MLMEKHGIHRIQLVEDMCFGEELDDPCILENNHPKSNAVQDKGYWTTIG